LQGISAALTPGPSPIFVIQVIDKPFQGEGRKRRGRTDAFGIFLNLQAWLPVSPPRPAITHEKSIVQIWERGSGG